MPRTLPWASGPRVKATPEPAVKRRRMVHESDEDLPSSATASLSTKRKQLSDHEYSDAEHEVASLARRARNRARKDRETANRGLSSSPVPTSPGTKPNVEPMRTAVSKYNLKDDGWMMVEDELLQTAKLFTRHLHLAEYERLKQDLQTRKKDIVRPVVANAKPSGESSFRKKAEALRKTQKRAREAAAVVFSDPDDSDDLDMPAPRPSERSSLPSEPTKARGGSSSRVLVKAATSPPRSQEPTGKIRPRMSIKAAFGKPDDGPANRTAERASAPKQSTSIRSSSTQSRLESPTESFTKPALPSKKRAPPPPNRPSLFDLLDEDDISPAPRLTNTSTPTSSFARASKPTPSGWDRNRKRDIRVDFGLARHKTQADGAADRTAKRKAEQQKKLEYDEIPTFLF